MTDREAFIGIMGCGPDSAPIAWQGFKAGWKAASIQSVGDISKPTAWMHDAENRPDCISDDVKRVLLASTPKIAEHYTVPLYLAPIVSDRLSAAAPDLLEMLRLLTEKGVRQSTGLGWNVRLRMARAAIDKATGAA